MYSLSSDLVLTTVNVTILARMPLFENIGVEPEFTLTQLLGKAEKPLLTRFAVRCNALKEF